MPISRRLTCFRGILLRTVIDLAFISPALRLHKTMTDDDNVPEEVSEEIGFLVGLRVGFRTGFFVSGFVGVFVGEGEGGEFPTISKLGVGRNVGIREPCVRLGFKLGWAESLPELPTDPAEGASDGSVEGLSELPLRRSDGCSVETRWMSVKNLENGKKSKKELTKGSGTLALATS